MHALCQQNGWQTWLFQLLQACDDSKFVTCCAQAAAVSASAAGSLPASTSDNSNSVVASGPEAAPASVWESASALSTELQQRLLDMLTSMWVHALTQVCKDAHTLFSPSLSSSLSIFSLYLTLSGRRSAMAGLWWSRPRRCCSSLCTKYVCAVCVSVRVTRVVLFG